MSNRLPQFEAQYTDRPLRIQERDLDILEKVYRYRFINSDQLRALFSPRVEEPAVQGEKTDEAITRRLQKLFHHGYLDRPKSQIQLRVRYGNLPLVYALGDKGAKELARERGRDIGKLNWQVKNSTVKHPYIMHKLMISEFRACLEVALRDKDKVNLSRWEDGRELESAPVTVRSPKGRSRNLKVVPDGFFGLKFTDRPEGENKAHFFLEADRSTMTDGRFFKKKVLGYINLKSSGKQRRLYDIEKFRVLTVTISEERRKNLKETAQKRLKSRAVSGRERARFLFACMDDYRLEDGSVLKKVFTDLRKDNLSLLPAGYL